MHTSVTIRRHGSEYTFTDDNGKLLSTDVTHLHRISRYQETRTMYPDDFTDLAFVLLYEPTSAAAVHKAWRDSFDQTERAMP